MRHAALVDASDTNVLVKQNSDVARPLSDLASDLNAEYRRVGEAMQSALLHARNCGHLLKEIKGRLPHGQFIRWLQTNFEGSVRLAQGYMNIEGGEPECLSDVGF